MADGSEGTDSRCGFGDDGGVDGGVDAAASVIHVMVVLLMMMMMAISPLAIVVTNLMQH